MNVLDLSTRVWRMTSTLDAWLKASHHWKAAERTLREWDMLRQSLTQPR